MQTIHVTTHSQNALRIVAALKNIPGHEDAFVMIDVSGSMPLATDRQAFADISDALAIAGSRKVTIVHFDTRIGKVYHSHSSDLRETFENMTFRDGGGSMIGPVFSYLNDNAPLNAPVFVLSDGFFHDGMNTDLGKNVIFMKMLDPRV